MPQVAFPMRLSIKPSPLISSATWTSCPPRFVCCRSPSLSYRVPLLPRLPTTVIGSHFGQAGTSKRDFSHPEAEKSPRQERAGAILSAHLSPTLASQLSLLAVPLAACGPVSIADI